MSYVALKRELSPTAAAVQFFNAIPSAINLGQGREVDDPEGKIGDLLKADLKTSCKYNSAPGGEMALREAAAGWVERFMGIPATGATTFLIQQLGREGLGHAMKVAALKNDPGSLMILPDTRWPMVDEKMEDERLDAIEYKIQRAGMAEEIDGLIQKNGKKISCVYFNFPHNPTGMHITREENQKVMDVLEAANASGNTIVRIDDIPYFGGCDQQDNAPYLKLGYDGVLKADSKTPWAAIFSFSKAFGTANPGLTIMVVHPSLATEVSKRLTRTTGLAYVPQFFGHVAEILKPENDKEVLGHFAALNKKYKENRKALEAAMGNSVIEGDPGMTSLIEVPEELFGRTVTCSDGQARTMNDLNDIIEFLGNEGVITVNNGGRLLRLAQAAHPDQFVEGVNRLKAALDKIRNSPMAEAA